MKTEIAGKLANLIGNICVGYKGSSPDHTPSSTKADLRKFLESLELPVTSSEVDTNGLSEQETVSLIGKNLKIQEDRFRKFVSDTLSEFESKLVEENNKRLSEFKSEVRNNASLDDIINGLNLEEKIHEAVEAQLKNLVIEKPQIKVEVYRGVEYDEKDKTKVVATYSRAKVPEFKHEGDSGADGYVCFDDNTDPNAYIGVGPGQVVQVPIGISCKIPKGYEIQLRPRSGESKFGHVAIFGTIDSKYRGVIKANIANISTDPLMINEGDRLCQLILKPVENVKYELVEGKIDTNTERGTNGFGSTGKK